MANGMVCVGSLDDSFYAYALNAGVNDAYRTNHPAPALSSLPPDYAQSPWKPNTKMPRPPTEE